MTTTEAIRAPEIYARMTQVMSDIGAIEKGRKNPQQGFMFRGIDDAYNALHGPLAKHGVFYVPEVLERDTHERQTKNGGSLLYVAVKMRFTFYAADGSSVSAVTYGEAMDSGDKATNKAMSAALKYCLMQTFCIPTEEDNDPDSTTHPPTDRVGNKKPEGKPTLATTGARVSDATSEKRRAWEALIEHRDKVLGKPLFAEIVGTDPELVDEWKPKDLNHAKAALAKCIAAASDLEKGADPAANTDVPW